MGIVRTKSSTLVVGVIFTAIGLLMLAAGIFWGLRMKTFVATSVHATGTVTELRESRSGDDGPTYRPVVTFKDENGEEVKFTSRTSTNPPSHRVGDQVKVLYMPEFPENAEIDSFMTIWFGPLLVGGVFGTIFPLVGILAMLSWLRERAIRRRLRKNGLRIAAEMQGVEGVKGGTGWTITAKATDPRGIQRIFRSAPIAVDPGMALLGRGTVEVLVDPDDYGTYEMDLAFLEGLAKTS